MTAKQIFALTRKWLNRLGMQTWHVNVLVCRYYEMDAGTLGTCEPNPITHKAIIRILDPNDIADPIDADVEVTIVHELLHCLFSQFEPDEASHDRAQHQVLHQLAYAYVALSREGKR